MRDATLMANTLQVIRDEGSGIARRVAVGAHAHQWRAGASVLNGQAVADLIADGWLRVEKHTSDASIVDAWPRFTTALRTEHHGNEPARLIRELRRQAEEYAKMGRGFPLFGAGSLFDALDALDQWLRTAKGNPEPPERAVNWLISLNDRPRPAASGSLHIRSAAMADYFLQLSCIFHVGSQENVARAFDIRGEMAAELYRHEGCDIGFEMESDHEYGAGVLWIYSGGYGEPEHVIGFALRCAEAFDLKGLWGFHWSLSCSRPRIGAFGGGAQLLDLSERQSVAWVDCESWLAEQLAGPPAPARTITDEGMAS